MSRMLYEVAQQLVSGEHAEERMLRVFQLLGEQMSFDRCALLEVKTDGPLRLLVVPSASPDERAALTERLTQLHRELGRDRWPARPQQAYLAVPLVGLDQVIGVLFISRDAPPYNDHHLRGLSLVGVQLGAYLTILRARAADAERVAQLEEARRAVAEAKRAKDELLALVARRLEVPLIAKLPGVDVRLVEPAVLLKAAIAAPLREDGGLRALRGIRVLLVDDDADIRDAFQLVLEHFGAEVLPVPSAAAAMAAIDSWHPDVLLSDLAMPIESGYDLMRQVAALAGAPPAAAFTAHRTEEGRGRAFAAGFRMYLAKPIETKALIAAVCELAGRPVGATH